MGLKTSSRPHPKDWFSSILRQAQDRLSSVQATRNYWESIGDDCYKTLTTPFLRLIFFNEGEILKKIKC